MSIRIQSVVFKSKLSRSGTWVVSTAATEPEALPADRYVLGTSGQAATFAEAIELAHSQRIELHNELMEQVHESRASLRTDSLITTMEATA